MKYKKSKEQTKKKQIQYSRTWQQKNIVKFENYQRIYNLANKERKQFYLFWYQLKQKKLAKKNQRNKFW